MNQGYPPRNSGQPQRTRRASNRQYDHQPPAQNYPQNPYPENVQPQTQNTQYYDHRIPYQSQNTVPNNTKVKKSLKKPLIIVCISVVMIGIAAAILIMSGGSGQNTASLTAYDIISAFDDAGMPLSNIIIYDESTDPNSLLGTQGSYTSKVSFADTRLEQDVTDIPVGGTIEVFQKASEAKERYEYTSSFEGTILGSYNYIQGNVVMRLDYDLSSAQAEIYGTLLGYVVNNQSIPEDFLSTIETSLTDSLQATQDSSTYDSFTSLISVVDCALGEDGKIVVIFENTGDIVVPEFDVQCLLKDSDGNVVSTESDGHDAVLPHSQVASIMRTDLDSTDFSTISVSIDADTSTNDYENHADELAISSNTGVDCVIVQITNNASVTIDELEVVVVFYRDGNIVGAREEEERDVSPGTEVTMQFDTPYDASTYDNVIYDSYEVFINQAHTF